MRHCIHKDGRINGLIEDLIDEPVVVTVNYFDEKSVRSFNEQISRAHATGQPIIPVVIDSYGGEIYSLLAMITTIQNSRIPISTIIEGKGMSCGSILFAFGKDRYISPHGTIMIHDVSHGCYGKIEETKASVQQAELLNNKVFRMMAENCHKPPDYFLDIIQKKGRADWYLDAKQAKRHGLATEIRIPELVTKLSVDISLT